ncbi:MAG TPA: tetratricopeptide repeat protein [Candidatus Polarisedimenticolaceae bacterium]
MRSFLPLLAILAVAPAALAAPPGLAELPARLDALERSTDPAAAAASMDELGIEVAQTGAEGSIAAAEGCFRRALAVRTNAFGERHPETAKSWSTLSDFAYVLGNWEDAEAHERTALAIRRDTLPAGDPAIAASLDSLGIVLLRMGRLGEAEALLAEAEKIRVGDASGDPAKLAETRNSLAELYRQQDRLDESEAVFRRALAKLAGGPDPTGVAARLENNLAGLLKDRGRLAEAEDLVRRSLEKRERAEEPDDGAMSVGLLNLAEILRLQGNPDGAEPLYLRSLELARKALGPGNPDLSTHLGQLAVLYRDSGRRTRARELFDEAQRLLAGTVGEEHPLTAQILDDRGRLEEMAERKDEAAALYRRALAIREAIFGADHFDTASTRASLARVLGSIEEAGKAIDALERLAAYPDVVARTRRLRATLLRSRGDLAEAERDLTAAAGAIETLRRDAGGGETARSAALARHRETFVELIDLLASQGRFSEAFAWSERARARALLDQLEAANVDVRSGIAGDRRKELEAKERAARTRLAEAQARLGSVPFRTDLPEERRRALAEAARAEAADAAAALRQVREETLNASALWREATGGPAANPDAVLRPDEVMLAYVVGEASSWAFVVKPGAPPTAVSLGREGRRSALDDALEGPAGVLDRISRPPRAGFDEDPSPELAALFERLVPEPVRSALESAKVAVIVADGPLARLPFEALVVAPGRYWLDAGPAVRYAPSATTLATLASRPPVPAERGVLTVSDPSYARAGASRWKPLPGTREESRAVSAAFRRTESLSGDRADEPGVRRALPNRWYVHLAVHGAVDYGRGDLVAGLALTPPAALARSGENDGMLQLYELYEMDLRSELAVLSACASGAGAAVEGESVFALARGFLARGARRVVATQWKVEDASAAALVGAFFGNLAREKSPDFTSALAEAKRKVRANPATAAPFYWAAFVLTGSR